MLFLIEFCLHLKDFLKNRKQVLGNYLAQQTSQRQQSETQQLRSRAMTI